MKLSRVVRGITMGAIAFCIAGCSAQTVSPNAATAVASTPASAETGGSAKGDFGPPQGEPIHGSVSV